MTTSDDEKSQLLSIIKDLNSQIDALKLKDESPAVTQARDNFTIQRFELTAAAFRQQLIASNVVLVLMVLVVICGLAFSFVHLKDSLRNKKPSTIEISLTQLKITSGVLGLLVLIISIAILFLYLKYVYPISTVTV
jgi:hypothetical protein